jgi:U1 small nuclear ribonucleoprotein 70kDa
MASGGLNLAAKLEAERKLKEGISGHRTGLPKRLLELFAPLDPLKVLTPIKKRPPKLPYQGMAWCVEHFAEPGDPEYEPPRAEDLPPDPRRFRNPELDTQARVDKESKAEK